MGLFRSSAGTVTFRAAIPAAGKVRAVGVVGSGGECNGSCLRYCCAQ